MEKWKKSEFQNTCVKIEHVTKRFGEDLVLKEVNLTLKVGQVYGVVGNNGSGKTVLMKCICGFLPVTTGTIRVFGKEIGRDVDFPEITVRKAGIALSRNERRIAQRTRSVAIPAPELLEPAREDHVVRQRGHRTHDRGAGQFVQPPLQAVEFEQPLVVAGIERSRIVFGHRPVLVGRPIIGRQQVDNAGTGGTRRHRRKHSGQETKQAVQELDRHKSLHGLGEKNRPYLRNIQTFARRNAPQRTGFSHDRSSPAPSDKR